MRHVVNAMSESMEWNVEVKVEPRLSLQIQNTFPMCISVDHVERWIWWDLIDQKYVCIIIVIIMIIIIIISIIIIIYMYCTYKYTIGLLWSLMHKSHPLNRNIFAFQTLNEHFCNTRPR